MTKIIMAQLGAILVSLFNDLVSQKLQQIRKATDYPPT